jgi:hypothetical protein
MLDTGEANEVSNNSFISVNTCSILSRKNKAFNCHLGPFPPSEPTRWFSSNNCLKQLKRIHKVPFGWDNASFTTEDFFVFFIVTEAPLTGYSFSSLMEPETI